MNSNSRIRKERAKVKTGSQRVISMNPKRNLQMIVEHGTDNKGKCFSQTFHVKINENEPAMPKPRRDIKRRNTQVEDKEK
jgi:hypothetical protein